MALLGISEFILLTVFKKKPLANKFSDIQNYLMKMIPTWINEAELQSLYGSDKKAFVVGKVSDYLTKSIDDNNTGWINDQIYFFNDYIESVLSTPRKKK